MIKLRREMPSRKHEIDLTGPKGNAFYLLGQAKSLCKQFDIESSDILEEMQASDYDNLVEVFDYNFGEYITLYR